MDSVVTISNWEARLELQFALKQLDNADTGSKRTVLTRRKHYGPLVVQRPFYPEQDTSHVYILHPPGGIAGGDQLSIHIEVGEHAHSLITTPAANKFYRSLGPLATQHQQLCIAKHGILEWLPQETIFFSGSRVHSNTRVELENDAKFIGWEILCLGRPASDESYHDGFCRQRIELWRNSQPIYIERALFAGENNASDNMLSAAWGLGGKTVTGTMLITPASTTELTSVRETVQANETELFSASLINDVLVLRYLGDHGEQARKVFTQAWQAIRQAFINKPACIPRIWNT